MSIESIQDVDYYLSEIAQFGGEGKKAAKFDLSRFKHFCTQMDYSHQHFPSIHVAGTNGKGSTCHILANVFQEAGYKTGLYTSPHILNINERFKINSNSISDDDLVVFFKQYHQQIKKAGLTYFEITTAIAFWWFSRSAVDIGIIEVGLGGRLDATNIIDPLLSVITSISLDHTDILGESIEEIAREKAGIIKPGKPVVIGEVPADGRDEILQIAEQMQSPVGLIDKLQPVCLEQGKYKLNINEKNLIIETPLLAPVQAKNIAIVWQVIQSLADQFPISRQQFLSALSHVDMEVGRFSRLTENQPWYFDGAHNEEAVRALKEAVKAIGCADKAILVLSMMRDKIRAGVMDEFSEFENIYYYQLNVERAATFDDIKKWLPRVHPFPDNYHRTFLDDFDSELVIFTGSFYFYATVREWVTNNALNR